MDDDFHSTLDAVGPRLRDLRQQRNVTLTALSERTGISVSTLSRLESGTRRPTLELLLPLAKAHGVTLDALVDAPETGDPRVHLRPMRMHGMTVLPLSRRPGGIQAYKFVMPGRDPDEVPRPQSHEGYEWLYVLNGRMRMILGDHELELAPGEAAEFDTRTPHWFGSAGDEPLEFLSLFGKQGERAHLRARPKQARPELPFASTTNTGRTGEGGAMRTVVVTDPPRAALADADRLGGYGVATVHEAIGRTGYLGPRMRPAWPGARIGGTAVTALCWPGDNLMIHVAVEQCHEGDILVVATNSPSTDGAFGELFGTALRHRGVRGAVLACGVRDTADLREMGFPVWSTAVSAQGTVKETAGAVNVPVVVEGRLIRPGDVIVADDDGALCVPRAEVGAAVDASAARAAKEAATREAFQRGELGLDRYGLRERLPGLGIRYVPYSEFAD